MRLKRLTPLIGGLLLTPVFVVAPVDLTMAGPAPHPVDGAAADVAMTPVASVASAGAVGSATLSAAEAGVARAQIAEDTEGTKDPGAAVNVLVESPAQPVPSHLAAVGVTWQPGSGSNAAVQIRTFKNGSWGPWELLGSNDAAPDAGRPGSSGRAGTELTMVTNATQVQARVLGAPGESVVEPKLTVIDPGRSDADATVGAAKVGAAEAVTARPNIYTREQWGADESWRTGTPEDNNPRGIVIHHTADSNDYTAADVPGMMRAMYRYATKTLGWDDIAYNFIIDRYGRIWQGRAWLYPEQPVFPAATLSNNDRTVGISMLGDYTTEVLSSAARTSLVQLLAWKASLHGINVNGTLGMYNNKNGQTEQMPTINGHRDTYSTACPGDNMYPLIPGIRRDVAALVNGSGNTTNSAATVFRDFDGMADSDIFGLDSSGKLMLSSPTGSGNMTAMETIGGLGWNAYDVVTDVGDWNGDGTDDLIARNSSTGDLMLYPGDGSGGFKAAAKIGTGWQGMQTIVAPGDWNGDGKPDIIATNKTNWNMYFYAGNGKGGFGLSGVQIGNGWGGIKSFAGIGSWNSDGKPSLAAVTFDGLGVLYHGDGKGNFATQLNQPGSWGGYATLTGVSNAFGDKKSAILGVTPSGSAAFGTRAANGTVTWKTMSRSFSGYKVYGG